MTSSEQPGPIGMCIVLCDYRHIINPPWKMEVTQSMLGTCTSKREPRASCLHVSRVVCCHNNQSASLMQMKDRSFSTFSSEFYRYFPIRLKN